MCCGECGIHSVHSKKLADKMWDCEDMKKKPCGGLYEAKLSPKNPIGVT